VDTALLRRHIGLGDFEAAAITDPQVLAKVHVIPEQDAEEWTQLKSVPRRADGSLSGGDAVRYARTPAF
jgi:hypothetical protein